MKRTALILLAAVATLTAAARQPLYIVNGVERESVRDIPQSNIESIDALPADEQTIARYGERANGGVILVTLTYDREAEFTGGESFGEWVAGHTKWPSHWPAARVAMRYTIEADGGLTLGEVLESTDSRLKKRVIKTALSSPAWIPAKRGTVGVASEYVLSVQLPDGKPMPAEPYIVIR